MSAALRDPAGVEHDDLVRVDHGGEAVGDDDAGAARPKVESLFSQPSRKKKLGGPTLIF
jgi:hypothetical protein